MNHEERRVNPSASEDAVSVTESVVRPNPATETVDKVITPESLRKQEAQNEALRQKARETERLLNK
ncbi:hypothetical protein [Pseudomonas sp. RIT-PI-AD]|uniref:hypothetical protein n=1 Tax=Pseudomonas sp. RIT-PI-AD TaxID=3035294 RepID=UPI0021D8562C|nr:hypothetical protein [Pseudomonas sp. RIT-PI-AD]